MDWEQQRLESVEEEMKRVRELDEDQGRRSYLRGEKLEGIWRGARGGEREIYIK